MFWIKLVAMLASLLNAPPAVQAREKESNQPPVRACAAAVTWRVDAPDVWAVIPRVARPVYLQCSAVAEGPADLPAPMVLVAPASSADAAAQRAAGDDDDDDDKDAAADDDADDAQPTPPPRRRALRFNEQTAPWIGVTLAPVPPVLGSHLKLDGDHLMIFNVAEDSPADKAGIEQYDVIVELNGKPVDGKSEEFSGRIRKMAVGDKAELVIVRGGSKKNIPITTVVRPKLDTVKYKYKTDANDEVVDTQESRGMMLRRDPNGQWRMLPFTPPAQPMQPVAPAPPTPLAPAAPRALMDLYGRGWPDAGSTFVIVESHDGATTEIRREANGEIKVSRSADSGNAKAKVRSYKSVDELKKGDPEAYAIYSRFRERSPQVRTWNWSDSASFKIDETVRREMERARQEMERALAAAQEATRQAQSFVRPHRMGRPDVRFDVDDDGRIKVITRDGDQELVQTFKNADELKARKPKLYERFQRLHEADSEND